MSLDRTVNIRYPNPVYKVLIKKLRPEHLKFINEAIESAILSMLMAISHDDVDYKK